jgi:hypothetical protein
VWGDSGDVGIGHVKSARVGARVMANHVSAHVICPLDDLGTNADEEGLGLPTAHQHDPLGGVVS